jgi:threonine dehydratase
VHVRMTVASEEPTEDLFLLREWLESDPALAGTVTLDEVDIKPDEMGSLSEVLVVALGSGGLATVIAGNLSAWMSSRKAEVTVTKTGADGSSASLTVKNVDDVDKVVKEFLDSVDGRS